MCSITNSLTHNFSSLFNFPQKSGILPEKLVLEILPYKSVKLLNNERAVGRGPVNSLADNISFCIRMRPPISGEIGPWNSLPSMLRLVRVVIFVRTMGNGPDNLFPIIDLHDFDFTRSTTCFCDSILQRD